MANKTAVYKQPHLLAAVEDWWDASLVYHPFRDVESMFEDYTDYQLHESKFECVMGLDEFSRCAYKIGIRRVGDGELQDFTRAAHWRPSDDSVMRFGGWL
jgi:hypothetical protein